MKRIVTYFAEGNLTPVEQWETTIEPNDIDDLKAIAGNYSNGRIYTNKSGNLCINYGRFVNEIVA